MIDTHSHIYGPEYSADRQQVIERAFANDVTHSVLANVDVSTIDELLTCHQNFFSCTSVAMGLHPTSVDADYKSSLNIIETKLSDNDYVAIGEVGIDLYWDKTFFEQQCDALKTQIDWALQLNLPLILHVRKAYAEVFDVLKQFRGHELRGIFHCFSGGVEEAKKAVGMGFCLGVGGTVTYKNSTLPDILRQIGLQHFVLETDAPYLSPVPNRGKRNEPANLVYVRDVLASIFSTNAQNVDEITTQNALKMFNIA